MKVDLHVGVNYFSELALGNIPGRTYVNKFGSAPDGIQTTNTDIWSRADATPTQQIWLAPTAARVHAIVSSSTLDTGFNVTVYGLQSWSSAETSETIALTGTTPVNTVNSYVIIHRMKCVWTASKTTNAGNITATAAVNNTVTAFIAIGDGQTEMAIYGVPSGKVALIHRWSCNMDRVVGTTPITVNFVLLVNENPSVQTVGFLRKSDISLISFGTSEHERRYTPPIPVVGPAIIKVQATASTADTEGESSFDLEIVDL